MVMSPQFKNSALGLYRCFKASSRFFINRLKSLVGILYKLNIINLDDSVCSSLAQISKSFYIQLCEVLTLLKYRSYEMKYTHHPSVDFDTLDSNM